MELRVNPAENLPGVKVLRGGGIKFFWMGTCLDGRDYPLFGRNPILASPGLYQVSVMLKTTQVMETKMKMILNWR